MHVELCRQKPLDRLIEIYGGPIEALSADSGLELLNKVNSIMSSDPHRPLSRDGDPGAVVDVPANLTPVLVGDLHARVDNLLNVLSDTSVLQELHLGTAALIFLGDAVHQDDPDSLESMDASVLMMDLILTLKLNYPEQVFFLLGNHDSFSEHVVKSGVAQGLLWEKHLQLIRGEAYRAAMERFYGHSPLLAISNDFVACHAGPPRAKVSRQILINARQSPAIARELIWNRLESPACPLGYTGADVRRFRKLLALGPDTPFIVAHTPIGETETVWQNVGRIRNHHVVYSARSDQVGVYVKIAGQMVPRVYQALPLLVNLNNRARRINLRRFVSDSPGPTLETLSHKDPQSITMKV